MSIPYCLHKELDHAKHLPWFMQNTSWVSTGGWNKETGQNQLCSWAIQYVMHIFVKSGVRRRETVCCFMCSCSMAAGCISCWCLVAWCSSSHISASGSSASLQSKETGEPCPGRGCKIKHFHELVNKGLEIVTSFGLAYNWRDVMKQSGKP